jgi:ParB family chromosome partitioning protein
MTTTAAPTFQVLPLAKLHESKLNPRKTFPPAGLEELAASIRKVGILQPLTVRPNGTGFEIGAGHRRARAAKLAQLTEVPCVVKPMTDLEFLELLVTENLQREDLHPLEQAEGYRTLMDKGGYDVAAVAAKVGKSVSYVYQRLKLAELAEPVKKAFLAEKLMAGHAILLARLQPKDQERGLKELENRSYRHRMISVAELEEWIRDEVICDLSRAPWDLKDAELVPKAGSCAACPKRTGNNPDLFGDLEKKPDRCMDGACFNGKTTAFLHRQRAAAEATGTKVVELSAKPSYYGTGGDKAGGPIPSDKWLRAGTKRCDHLATGLIVKTDPYAHGREQLAKGTILKVCTNLACKIHNPKQADGVRKQRRVDEDGKRQHAKAEFEDQVRERVYRAIVAKGGPAHAIDWRMIAHGFLVGDVYEAMELAASALYDKGGEAPDGQVVLEAKVRSATPAEAQRIVFAVALAAHLEGWQKPDYLLEVAKARKIDPKKIAAALKAEAKTKAVESTAKPAGKKKGRAA